MYNNNMLRNVLKRLKIGRSGLIRDENQYLSLIRDILEEGEEPQVAFEKIDLDGAACVAFHTVQTTRQNERVRSFSKDGDVDRKAFGVPIGRRYDFPSV